MDVVSREHALDGGGAFPAASAATPPSTRSAWIALALSVAVALALHLSFGDVNLNLADEGYLWYGVVGVLDGEVPFRDFQAYDPGRYYWCAALSPVFGSGILGVRAAVATFLVLGMTAGLLVVRRLCARDAGMVVPALVLALWMFPRHKLFEPSIALIVLWSVVRLLERPTRARHLATGVVVGLVAFFGRNHGLYAGLAALAASGLAFWRGASFAADERPPLGARATSLALGTLLGYSPMLLMLAFVPGFAPAFVDALLDLLTKGANVPRDYPWPWTQDFGDADGLELFARVSMAVGFLLPVVLLPIGLAIGATTKGADVRRRAVLLGATIVGLVYAHHVSVRSDAPHLGQCIQPVLVLALALVGRRFGRWIGWTLLGALSVGAAFDSHTTLRWFAPWREAPPAFREVDVAGETMRLMPPQAVTIEGLYASVGARLEPGDEIFIAPSRPTYYPVLGVRSPVKDIYLFWFAPEEDQRAIVAALDEHPVRWVLIVDTLVDDREDLRFPSTHELVWKHLEENYVRVPTPGLKPDHVLLRRRGAGRAAGRTGPEGGTDR